MREGRGFTFRRERDQNTSYWMLNHAESIGGNT